LYLGWQYATPHADPGPPPRSPAPAARPPEPRQVTDGWLAARRREENIITRPLKITGVAAAVIACVLAAGAAAVGARAAVAAPAAAACLVAALLSGYAIWHGQRALRARAGAERLRAERLRAGRERRLAQERDGHARRVRQWQAQRSAFA